MASLMEPDEHYMDVALGLAREARRHSVAVGGDTGGGGGGGW